MTATIASVHTRRVWDSRGRPTVEVEVTTAGGAMGRAIAPAGASTGSGEAIDLRDGGPAFGGLDVQTALTRIAEEIAPAIIGMDCREQRQIDAALVALDGTAQLSRLGGNAVIATSLAVLHTAAASEGLPLWAHLAGTTPPAHLPLPEVQIFGGGAHAARRVDVQDFMVVPVGADDYREALEWVARVYAAAGTLMAETGRLAGVADEGGFWPVFETNEEALTTLVTAIERAGLRPREDVAISLDIAASEFGEGGAYRLARDGLDMTSDALIDLLRGWLRTYPIVAVEDPLGEDDVDGLARFTAASDGNLEIIADDAAVTDAARVRTLAARGACNAVLIKPNQVGTVSGTWDALAAAREVGWGAVVSARSGETEDVSIVHLAVGWGIPQLKVGSFARSERMAKWNEGLRIGDVAPCGFALPDKRSFLWAKG